MDNPVEKRFIFNGAAVAADLARLKRVLEH